MIHVYELDGRRLSDKTEAHVYLQETLPLPEYYGRNLDALYDVLTEQGEDMLLWILHAEAAISAVLEDAMEENPFLTVIFEESDREDSDEAD